MGHTATTDGRFVDLGVGPIHYYRWGEGGPAVVFESGLCSPGFVWKPEAETLSEHTTVVAYDRPGYGRSAPGARPRTTRQVARELAELIEALDLAPCVLVGHSFGGVVIDHVAAERRELVAGLVFVDSADPHQFARRARDSAAGLGERRRGMRLQSLPALGALGLAHARLARPLARAVPQVRARLGPLIYRIPTFWSDAEATIHPSYFKAVIDETSNWVDSLAASGTDPPLVDVPVAVLTATHYGENLLSRSSTPRRARLPSLLLTGRRRAEALSPNWTWRAVDGPHELCVTAPDAISAAVLDVVCSARTGESLHQSPATVLPAADLDRLVETLGDRPRTALNCFGIDPARAGEHGANEHLVAEGSRRSTRRSLLRWAQASGECLSITAIEAVDYGWTLVVQYRATFARGMTATLEVHLDSAGQLADLAVTSDQTA